jgi:CubicO group peptidase (beta-lactamase class C family)
MKIYSRFLHVLLLFITTIAYSQNSFNEKKLDKKLETLQEATKTVGFSVAIVKGNQLIYSKGFGYKDLEKKLKADANTLFAIGSTSKAFTTALLGIMEDEKDLKFSDSPRKYIPELEFYNNDLNNTITIADMVSHRTGLPRHDMSWYLFPVESKSELLSRVKYHEPFTGIRQQWYYNNFMYLAQGIIAEKLTGKSWEDNIRERFFKPLNMTTSNLTIEELEKSTNFSRGYVLENFSTNKVTPYFNIGAISPAGSINSSANEMANWLKIWLNEGKLNSTQVLPEKYIEKAVNPLMLVGKGIADKQFPDQHLNSYGYAWFTSSYKGHYRLEHGGNIDGFSANVALFPTDKIGIVVLTNQDGSALPTLVRNTIADVILDLNETNWEDYYNKLISNLKKQESEQENEEKEIIATSPTHNLTEYSGNYNHPGYGDFKIEVTNDSLWVNFTREKAFLKHIHYDIFKPSLVTDNKVDIADELGFNFNFETNDLGDISGVNLKLEPTLKPLFFKRSPNEIDVSQEDISKHVGSYVLSGTELKVSVKNNKLMLFVPGQPEYTLTPIKTNEFILKGLTGYKAEFKDNNLILHQPNGTFTATKK